MTRGRAFLLAWIAASLAACSSAPVPPWNGAAASALSAYRSAYLQGQERLASNEFERARAAVAQTARPELVARVELTRCALQVASLDFAPCAGYAPLAGDATPAERAYAAYLSGAATAADVAALPASYHAGAQGAVVQPEALTDPHSALIAAGVLQRQGRATPAMAAQAVAVASRWGWRRPLAAWLALQAEQASAAGDAPALARIQRRLELLRASAPAR